MHSEDHLDRDVRSAILRLCDALCSWERATGRTSMLVIRESDGDEGFFFRAVSGKPVPAGNDNIPDEQLAAQEAPETLRRCPSAFATDMIRSRMLSGLDL